MSRCAPDCCRDELQRRAVDCTATMRTQDAPPVGGPQRRKAGRLSKAGQRAVAWKRRLPDYEPSRGAPGALPDQEPQNQNRSFVECSPRTPPKGAEFSHARCRGGRATTTHKINKKPCGGAPTALERGHLGQLIGHGPQAQRNKRAKAPLGLGISQNPREPQGEMRHGRSQAAPRGPQRFANSSLAHGSTPACADQCRSDPLSLGRRRATGSRRALRRTGGCRRQAAP